jgi:hypothetical protein
MGKIVCRIARMPPPHPDHPVRYPENPDSKTEKGVNDHDR